MLSVFRRNDKDANSGNRSRSNLLIPFEAGLFRSILRWLTLKAHLAACVVNVCNLLIMTQLATLWAM